MRAVLLALVALTACACHRPYRWHGIPAGASVSCPTYGRDELPCVVEDHGARQVYYCVRNYHPDSIDMDCAPLGAYAGSLLQSP